MAPIVAKRMTAPVVTPLVGTLLDAATVTEGIEWLEPDGLFESYNCMVTDRRATWPCPTDTQEEKTFENPSWLDGTRFTVYGGIMCKPFGFDGEHGLSEARRVFEARESYGVERAVMETLLQDATDLTGAGAAVSPKVGLALLEGDAAANYAGVPTIHVPRSVGTLLFGENVIVEQGNEYFSHQGSKVASGGGYVTTNVSPAGDAAAAGEAWIYASGEVVVARGTVTAEQVLDQTTNDTKVLVERTYVASIDCYKAAVKVSIA